MTALLLGAGVEAAHARDMGLARSPDAVILGVTADGGWVIVTHDADFSQLLALRGLERPSVVHLRREFESNGELVACVERTLAAVGPELAAGAIVSVDDAAVRVRRLPVLGRRSTPP